MSRFGLAFLLIGTGIVSVACEDDSTDQPTDVLPDAPQIFPNAQQGVIGFNLTLQDESQTIDAVFVNGGKQDLVVSSIELLNNASNAFVLTQPASLTVESRHALGAAITFTSPGRGVYLADLLVKSNAENYPELTLALVAPGAGLRVPDEPDIAPFESTIEIKDSVAGLSMPAALVRLYNLGGASLELYGYTLSDTTNFKLLDGTAVPGITCKPSGPCVPASGQEANRGCCGDLECVTPDETPLAGTCSPVLVPRGQFVIFGVTWADTATTGEHTGTISIASNDPEEGQDVISVTVTGTKP